MNKGTRALKFNTLSTLLSEIVTLVAGLIMPKLVLTFFGSTSNGLISSITQFLGFSVILRAGMGGAIRAALYRPIAENDENEISAIMAATDRHMKKISAIIAVAVLIFACIYPLFVLDEYSWFYAFTMVLVIGTGSLVENLFGIKCQILIQADQKYYISTLISIAGHILVTVTSAVIMLCGGSMHLVKIGAVIAAFINPLLLNLYVRKNYRINWNAIPDEKAIGQRWNAFFQQVAVVINENVALVILTILQPLASVSVYTIHAMVVFNIRAIVNSFSNGLNSAFGNMLATKEIDSLKKTFFFSEWLVFAMGCLLYSVTAVMLSPFISLYTYSITDVNYHHPLFGVLMVVSVVIASVKLPYQYLAEGAGKFRETRTGALVEVIINISVSVICVIKFGFIGVLIGAICSGAIRTIEYAFFSFKTLLNHSRWHLVKHWFIVAVTFSMCFFVGKNVCFWDCSDYLYWAINAVFVTASSAAIIIIVSIVFYKKQLILFLGGLKRKIKK